MVSIILTASLFCGIPVTPTAPVAHPVVIGVDTAGPTLSDVYKIHYWNHEPFYQALDELGVEFVVVHLVPWSRPGVDTAPLIAERMLEIDRSMKAHGKRYALNLETPNFITSIEVTPGRNEFAQPGGRHFWLVRRQWLDPILDAAGPRSLTSPPPFPSSHGARWEKPLVKGRSYPHIHSYAQKRKK